MPVSINPTIFRDYDIRGTYPDQLNEETYYVIGRALAEYLHVSQIAVGHDTRLSSPSLSKSLIRGIIDNGTNVVDLGLISTEIHYYASGSRNFPANVIISASHNPGNYNGLKIVIKGVKPLHGNFGLPEIKKLTIEQNFSKIKKTGEVTKLDLMDQWIIHALEFIDKSKLANLKVVVDAGNGMGGISWKKLIGKTNVEIIPLYFKPDGHFPHHLPDPLKKENLKDLISMIQRNQADLGIALDGDADRMFLVDEKGHEVSGTITTAILADALLSKEKGQSVLYNAVCGRIVPETILKHQGRPVRVRVGHSFIKESMRMEKALFAGEHSGHFYFRDNYYAESYLIAGLVILEYLSSKNRKLSEISYEFNKYPSSGEINFKVEDPQNCIKKAATLFNGYKAKDWIDGLSVWYNDWWFNLRVSKTETYIRLNIEADNKELLDNKLHFVENKIIELNGVRV